MIERIFIGSGNIIEKLKHLDIMMSVNNVPQDEMENELIRNNIISIEIDQEKGTIKFIKDTRKLAIDSFMIVSYIFTPKIIHKEESLNPNKKWYHKFLRRNKSYKGSSFI